MISTAYQHDLQWEGEAERQCDEKGGDNLESRAVLLHAHEGQPYGAPQQPGRPAGRRSAPATARARAEPQGYC
eukprot:COSAG06_NODE_41868_length_387_cov_0.649306_2_plen_72_part_01